MGTEHVFQTTISMAMFHSYGSLPEGTVYEYDPKETPPHLFLVLLCFTTALKPPGTGRFGSPTCRWADVQNLEMNCRVSRKYLHFVGDR